MRTLPTLLLLSLSLAACKRTPPQLPSGPPIVQVAVPLKKDVPIVAEAIAQTEATANVDVMARVEATVEKILFVEGSEVKAGDPLFLLDKKPIEQRLAAAKGNLGQLEANLGRTQQDVQRLRPLAKSGAVPQKDLDTAIAVEKQAIAALDTGKAQVTAAELDLGYTDVAAPVAGIIGAKQVDVGSLVGKGLPTMMATISPLDPIWANVEISEVAYLNSAGKFKDPGNQTAFALVLANGQVHPHLGKLAFVDRIVNASTGTLKCRVEFPNPQKILRPGQFCRVRALTRTLSGALLIPQRAVQELQGLHNVFVVAADGKAAFRRVKMSRRIGSLWIVESGLAADERIVIEGLQKVRDGLQVEPQPTEIDDAPLQELLSSVPGQKN
ncbi:MAG: efflux RND transporter periplasmic adaptor subunit [Verrucomicrobiaceae bacterium]|nr:efflux RND transporter periplasmic adaptor subunit [Verrucomicrobiaceae bacterium]